MSGGFLSHLIIMSYLAFFSPHLRKQYNIFLYRLPLKNEDINMMHFLRGTLNFQSTNLTDSCLYENILIEKHVVRKPFCSETILFRNHFDRKHVVRKLC